MKIHLADFSTSMLKDRQMDKIPKTLDSYCKIPIRNKPVKI